MSAYNTQSIVLILTEPPDISTDHPICNLESLLNGVNNLRLYELTRDLPGSEKTYTIHF